MLELIDVGKQVGNERHIEGVNLRLEKGTLNVLLGPTLAGKTTLMRLMAGLDRPTAGDVRVEGTSVLGVPVQKRNVAMVYQQFINYPALTVYENIASPMRVGGKGAADVDRRVRAAAELMKLTDFLDRTPLNLSGGQQQRTALARALVKDADLVLLDEPLANLDYKLREELRAELPKLFAELGAVLVYATTEPQEALLLGGNTATLSQGQLTQFGPTIDVYSRPADLQTAQTFSDPPLNTLAMVKHGDELRAGALSVPAPDTLRTLADGRYTVGIRPHHLLLHRPPGDALEVSGVVATSEITGSESFIHIDSDAGEQTGTLRWVALIHNVHRVDSGARIPVYLDPLRFYLFDAGDRLAAAPQAQEYGGDHG